MLAPVGPAEDPWCAVGNTMRRRTKKGTLSTDLHHHLYVEFSYSKIHCYLTSYKKQRINCNSFLCSRTLVEGKRKEVSSFQFSRDLKLLIFFAVYQAPRDDLKWTPSWNKWNTGYINTAPALRCVVFGPLFLLGRKAKSRVSSECERMKEWEGFRWVLGSWDSDDHGIVLSIQREGKRDQAEGRRAWVGKPSVWKNPLKEWQLRWEMSEYLDSKLGDQKVEYSKCYLCCYCFSSFSALPWVLSVAGIPSGESWGAWAVTQKMRKRENWEIFQELLPPHSSSFPPAI